MAKTPLHTEPPPFSNPAEASHRHILRALKSILATEEHPKTFRAKDMDKFKRAQGEWIDKFKKKLSASNKEAWKTFGSEVFQ